MGRANIGATHFSYITDESLDRVSNDSKDSNDLRVTGPHSVKDTA